MAYKTKGYIVLEGSIAEGYVAYGPFADAVKAFDFQQELKDTHGGRNNTIVFSLIDPKREFEWTSEVAKFPNVVKAWEEGKDIQCWDGSQWISWTHSSDPPHVSGFTPWRINPEEE